VLKLRRDRNEQPTAAAPHAEVMTPLGNSGPVAPIGELLLSSGAIDAADLANALAAQTGSGRRLGSVLLENGLISQRQLDEALSKQSGVELVDLRHRSPTKEALALVPESVARSMDLIPLEVVDGTLHVAVADPHDRRLSDVLSNLRAERVEVFLASLNTIRDTVNTCYTALAGIVDLAKTHQRLSANSNTDNDDAGPVVEVVNRIVAQAMRDRSSDVHLEPTPDHLRVRYRIDGALNEVVTLPVEIAPAVINRLKIMAGMNIVEKRRPQDGQFHTVVDGRDLDVRVATTSTIFGEKAVLRLLDKTRSRFDLVDLGMPKRTAEQFDGIVHSPFGMVVVAGPTGSGKTTTLYATLSKLARPELNVTTIEDPVEYVFPAVTQIEVNPTAGVTFAGGLRAVLRQDPDIVLVGEIRDAETATIAVQAALTGHLVLSSLHATDATSALFRLLDMGIERFIIASSLTGVVAQRLLRRMCKACMVSYEPTPAELAFYEAGGGPEKSEFLRGEGCNTCSNTGYRDRIGVYEILTVSDELRYGLINDVPPTELRKIAIADGMRTLRSEAIRLVRDDVTTIDEVMHTIYTL
jgi:type IV pilus assembly protein PilB